MHLCKCCKYRNTKYCSRNKDEELDRIKYEKVYLGSRYIIMKMCYGLEEILMKHVSKDEREKAEIGCKIYFD